MSRFPPIQVQNRRSDLIVMHWQDFQNGSCIQPEDMRNKFSSSFSQRDISELIRSWMGQQSFCEYERELQASSGPEFQMRVLKCDKKGNSDPDQCPLSSAIEIEVNSSFQGLTLTVEQTNDDTNPIEEKPKLQRSESKLTFQFLSLLLILALGNSAVSVGNIPSGWPIFSRSYDEFEAITQTFDTFTFNALDYSDDDLTVLIGQLFHQVQ